MEEDNFHYNFFLNDVEKVLGYTLDRFGSYAAVLRHIWGDDSKAACSPVTIQLGSLREEVRRPDGRASNL